MNLKSFAVGIVVGTAVAASTTLLVAPKSGKEQRTYIKDQAKEMVQSVEKIKDSGKKLSEQFLATSKEGVEVIKEFSKDILGSIDHWQKTIKPHQDKVERYLLEIENRLQELEQETNTNYS